MPRRRGVKIATAESCTGGMVAALLTSIAGSSDVFDCGFVTYSNEAKIGMLGVSPDTISEFGAVSRECALAMAHGAILKSGGHACRFDHRNCGTCAADQPQSLWGWCISPAPEGMARHFTGKRGSAISGARACAGLQSRWRWTCWRLSSCRVSRRGLRRRS